MQITKGLVVKCGESRWVVLSEPKNIESKVRLGSVVNAHEFYSPMSVLIRFFTSTEGDPLEAPSDLFWDRLDKTCRLKKIS